MSNPVWNAVSTVIFLVIVLILWGIGIYNKLIKKYNRVENAAAQISVQLQRRLDLIPNLVETVKGYATHEKETLQKVIEARQQVVRAEGLEEKLAADNMLSSTLRSLFAVSENYPDLKANTNFLSLQSDLKDTEDKISYMRQSFNDVVMSYNVAIAQFPALIIAKICNFKPRAEYYQAQTEAESAPRVKF